MISRTRFARLVEEERIVSVRVVPVPMEKAWCIDVIMRMPMDAGSQADTVASKNGGKDDAGLSRFPSIDAAANYLRGVGVKSFVVDTDDAITFANVDSPVMRVVETSAQLWDDEDHGEVATSN